MSPTKLVEVEDGVVIAASSTFDVRFLYNELFRESGYGELALPERAFVVDVGANIGLFTLLVKARHPDAEVAAFEPVPELVAVLRENVRLRGLDDVVVNQLALGSASERDVPFTYYPVLPSSSTRYPGALGRLKSVMAASFGARVVDRMYRGRAITVTVERLSAFLDAARPVDLLKIDVVGAELEVLQGIDPPHWPLVRDVLIDVQDIGDRIASLCELLSTQGLVPTVTPARLADGDGLNYLIRARREGGSR